MKRNFYAALVILSGVFWGSSCLFVNYFSNNTPYTSFHITAIRFTVAAVILNLLLLIKGRGFSLYRITLKAFLITLISGVFSVFGMSALYFSCMLQTSASVAVILLYTAPVFVMIMSLIFFHERMTPKKLISFVFAIVGCALVSGIVSGASFNAVGLLLGLAGGFAYSLYGILTAFFMKEHNNPITFTALSFLFASIASLVVSQPWKIVAFVPKSSEPFTLLAVCIGLGLCTAVIPFLLYTLGLKGVKPDIASILAFSEPLTACLYGTFILHQPMDLFGVIGIACVCTAIVILNLPKRKHA